MKSAVRNILFFGFYVSICCAGEYKSVNTNREVFLALSDSVIDAIATQYIKQYSSVTIKTNNDTFTKYFRPQFISWLTSNDKTVFENSTVPETTLELTVQESSVFFGEIFTESFLGKRMVERKIRLTVLAILISTADGKILFSDQFSKSSIDTVSLNETEHMDDGSLPMTNYQKPEVSFLDSVLEPAIVIFSTGIAVYLFFTIRS